MNKTIYILFACLCFNVLAMSQDTTAIATEKVEVIKNYEAIIQQAQKKELNSDAIPKTIIPIEYNYSIQSEAKLDFDRPEEIIRPISYSDPQVDKEDIKDGSIYGGYGTLSSLNFGAAYHYYIEDWLNAGFNFDHLSAKDPDLAHQKYNQNKGNLYANYFMTPRTQLGANVLYHKSEHNTLDPMDTVSTQSFDRIGADVSFNSTAFEKAGLAFRLKAGYDQLKHKQDDTKENRLRASVNIFKRISDKIKFEIPAEIIKLDFKRDSSIHNPLDIIIQPQLGFKLSEHNAKIGIEFIKADTSQFIFPLIDVLLENIYEGINVELYTSSNFNRNGMHYLYQINPYYRTDLSTLNVNYLRSYNLKLTKSHNDLGFALRFSYNDYTGDDMHFDRSDTNRAIVGTIDRSEIQINPSIAYTTEIADINLSYTHNIFQGDNKDNLLYRPKSLLELNLVEELLDSKLVLKQSLNFSSSRKTTHPLDEDMLLDSYFDINLGLDLRINSSISIYVNALNILGTEYEVWYGHPAFQRQIFGGLRVNI